MVRREGMSTIQSFEEIEAWQKARELTRMVYAISNKGAFAKDFSLRDQMRRAVVSIMSNIAEGFERGGSAEFIQFLSIAKGSAGEVESQLYIAFDQGYISKEEFDSIRELTSSTKRLIAGFMKYLKSSNMKGQKFKHKAGMRDHKPETKKTRDYEP
jgi:four helix bundle protein